MENLNQTTNDLAAVSVANVTELTSLDTKETTMKNLLEIHPYANIFPLLDEKELDALAKDIKNNGQRETIKLLDGKILDGRNRYAACLKEGVTPKLENVEVKDALEYVLSLNLSRRHLKESQRAWVAANIVNQKQDGQTCTQYDAAKRLNVSLRSVNSAIAAQKTAVPELYEAVQKGEIAVSVAAKISALQPSVQKQIIPLGKKKMLQAIKQTEKNDPIVASRPHNVTIAFTDEELKAFDKARKRHHCDDSREAFIHYLVVDFSDEKSLPPTKLELKKIIKEGNKTYYESQAFANLPTERRSPNGEADTDKDHPDYEPKERAREAKLDQQYNRSLGGKKMDPYQKRQWAKSLTKSLAAGKKKEKKHQKRAVMELAGCGGTKITDKIRAEETKDDLAEVLNARKTEEDELRSLIR